MILKVGLEFGVLKCHLANVYVESRCLVITRPGLNSVLSYLFMMSIIINYSVVVITLLVALFLFLDEVKAHKKQQQTPSSAKVMELVSTNRQGVSKQVKRLQGRLGSGKSKATVKDKRIKSAVGQYSLNCLNYI